MTGAAETKCRAAGERGLAVLSLVLGLAGLTSAQGKLEGVRDEVRDPHEGSVEPTEYEGDDGDYLDAVADGLEAELTDGAFEFLVNVVFVPFVAPRAVLGDRDLEPCRFARTPDSDAGGYWLRLADTTSDRKFSIRPRVESGTDFDDLERFGLALQLEHASRFGLDAAWNRWREDVGPGGSDELDLGDVNLVYRFAQGPHAAFRAGLGLNYLNDDIDEDFGVNFTYGADFLIGRHASIGLETDFGTLGDASTYHVRGTLGLVLESFELFASAEHFDVDGVGLPSYGLGLRAWW